MAKKSVRAREAKRTMLAQKYQERRDAFRAVLKSATASFEEKMNAQVSLQKLPRDSSKIRGRRRCALTGRPRGVFRKFGLGRNKLRELAMMGVIPGLRKASW